MTAANTTKATARTTAAKAAKAPAKAAQAPVAAPVITKAIRELDVTKTTNVNVPDTTTRAKIVVAKSGSARIDHTNCTHATSGTEGKKARAKCRTAIEKYITTK